MTAHPCQVGDVLLELRGVSVTRGGVTILRDLNLEVRDLIRPGMTQGQIVGLLGPSGVGKTTLFRILAGLEKPDAGSVTLGVERTAVERGMVGVIAQDYPLFAHRTVMGNLLVAGRCGGLSGAKNEEQARSLLERFGLEEHARKYPAQLSGGQRQRVAIAQQFMCSEHLLLMDEPFTGLDLLAEDNLLAFIREMARQDELGTFIVVTHDITAALQIADTIWLLGRDRNADGTVIPGARIQATYNLWERGLAWQEVGADSQEFFELRREIREFFPRL